MFSSVRNTYIFATLFCFLVGALFGCTPGKRPFLTAQVCVRDAQELAQFTRAIQLIAQSEGMRFFDRSEESERELKGLHSSALTIPTVNMSASKANGVWFVATNLGLPRYQLAVSFSEGSNPVEAHRLAEDVVRKLQAQWHVKIVPAGRGALPIENCLDNPVN
jgi:hypothetical protein